MKQLKITWQVVGDALQLGLSIVLAIVVGTAFGWWLDGKVGTFPYLSIVFFFIGVGAAGRNVWRVVRRQLEQDEDKRGK